MAPCLWAASPPGVGPPARSRGARAPDSRPSGRARVSGELGRLSRERRTSGGEGRADPGDLGPQRLDLACPGRNGLPHAARPVAERTATGTPRTAGCGLGRARGPCESGSSLSAACLCVSARRQVPGTGRSITSGCSMKAMKVPLGMRALVLCRDLPAKVRLDRKCQIHNTHRTPRRDDQRRLNAPSISCRSRHRCDSLGGSTISAVITVPAGTSRRRVLLAIK